MLLILCETRLSCLSFCRLQTQIHQWNKSATDKSINVLAVSMFANEFWITRTFSRAANKRKIFFHLQTLNWSSFSLMNFFFVLKIRRRFARISAVFQQSSSRLANIENSNIAFNSEIEINNFYTVQKSD